MADSPTSVTRWPAAAIVQSPTSVSPDWRVVVDAFLGTAVDSVHTRRAYRRHLYQAFATMGQRTIAELSGTDLADYRRVITGSALAPSSQGQALAALRSFLSWLRTMGAHQLSGDVVAVALKTPWSTVQQPYNVLTEPEVGAMISSAGTPRDRALLGVLLGAGLRVAEVVALDVADFLEDYEGDGALHVRQGKGRKDRVVPLRREVALLLKRYLASSGRRVGGVGPLFRAHDPASKKLSRGRLSARAVAYLVERSTRSAGIEAKRVSPHVLRHTYALRALRAGGNVVAVQKLLGHANIATTQRYVDHLAIAELRNAVPPLPI